MAAASRTAKTESPKAKAKADRLTCGSPNRDGQTTCKRGAGAGTDHPGTGHCTIHGGGKKTSQVTRKARHRVELLGLELDIEPYDALRLTIRQEAAWAAYCANEVAHLDPSELVVHHRHERDAWGGENATSYVDTTSATEMHIWVRESQASRERLSKLAKTAIDAGLAEREVRLLEQNADDLASWLGPLLDDLGVRGDDRTPAVVRKHLMLLPGGLGKAA